MKRSEAKSSRKARFFISEWMGFNFLFHEDNVPGAYLNLVKKLSISCKPAGLPVFSNLKMKIIQSTLFGEEIFSNKIDWKNLHVKIFSENFSLLKKCHGFLGVGRFS